MPRYPQLICNLTDTEKNSSGIYVLRNAHDLRVYVGAAKHLGRACASTRHELRQGRHASRQLQAYAITHGLASLRFEVLELCPVDELPTAKQRQVAAHLATDPAHGFNTLASAGFTQGQVLSDEHRARISAGKVGRPITPRTAEHQEKLASAHRGRTRSPETRAAISAATTGKKKHRKAPPAA
ncbi:hypothetical protein GCM10023172_27510 [Hymenobacter ginsengisoli]|uniref:Nuclease associated modular domain-containing protein n=1 Tax=Hymenobacter ginsengisoli TaxID=1051626 RepID=A0ABP8QIK5_9BACT|nr:MULTISPECIES: NUMOD3 domain-containing DNA-binding protein [unclassified Hymenobacter]MBO2029994.1 hypothetical protein [Hymenobacter sp. BT559]